MLIPEKQDTGDASTVSFGFRLDRFSSRQCSIVYIFDAMTTALEDIDSLLTGRQ